ncbi:hypothetical protein D3C86_1038670 [compost metagenome]
MSTLFFTNRLAPKASAIVTIAGKASGMAATASEIAVINMVTADSPRSKPIKKIAVQIKSITTDNRFPKAANLFCNGVMVSLV